MLVKSFISQAYILRPTLINLYYAMTVYQEWFNSQFRMHCSEQQDMTKVPHWNGKDIEDLALLYIWHFLFLHSLSICAKIVNPSKYWVAIRVQTVTLKIKIHFGKLLNIDNIYNTVLLKCHLKAKTHCCTVHRAIATETLCGHLPLRCTSTCQVRFIHCFCAPFYMF